MGDKNIQLSWSWPLVSYKWLPEILDSINHVIEPSWSGLNREMTTHAANASIGNKIFSQLKTLLIESQLVQEQGRYITPTVQPVENQVREHLFSIFSLSNLPWTLFYHHAVTKKVRVIFFQELKSTPPEQWPEVSNYPIFKQWSEFFQYLGLGFLIDNKQFIIGSAITGNMSKDTLFMEKCCKSLGDPRHLTGRNCLHTEADFLAWTRGEDTLAISTDKELFPRIPADHITNFFENTNSSKGWHSGIKEGISFWDRWITNHLKNYPFSDLTTLILTVKTVLDFFLFGHEKLEPIDDIRKVVLSARQKWETIPYFQISGTVWQVLPKLYQDITRLNYGVTFYRNSLKKKSCFSECVQTQILTITKNELEKAKKIPLRGFRSKRSLYSILHTASTINTALTRIEQKNSYVTLEEYVLNKSASVRSFLPDDPIDRQKILDELEELIEFHEEDRETLLTIERPVFSCGHQSSIIQLSYWAHLYYDINHNHSVAVINRLRKKMNKLEQKKMKEIHYYHNNMEIWNKSFNDFQSQMQRLQRESCENPSAKN